MSNKLEEDIAKMAERAEDLCRFANEGAQSKDEKLDAYSDAAFAAIRAYRAERLLREAAEWTVRVMDGSGWGPDQQEKLRAQAAVLVKGE